MVVLDQERVDAIKQCLRDQPRGMTITDLAYRLHLNRILIARYLDMLVIAGQVEMQTFGPAQVYSLSQRVPISAMLEFSSDFVVVIDAEGRLIQVNEPVTRLLRVSRETLVGNRIEEIDSPFFRCIPAQAPAQSEKTEGETVLETSCGLAGKIRYFRIKMVRTAFEDGSPGTTCIIEDITVKKESEARISRYIGNLEFLAKTSAHFADMSDDENIYQYMADCITQLEPKAHVVVMSINPDTRVTFLRAVAGDEGLTRILFEHFGNFSQGNVSMEKTPEVWDDIQKGALVKGPDSLYVQTYQMFPKEICDEVQERLSIGNSYAIGCMCRMGIYGNIAIRYRFKDDIQNPETVEAFVRQAGVALQRRHLREKLRVAEEKIRTLEGRQSDPVEVKPRA